MNWLKSKTVWAGIIGALGQVLPLIDSGLFGPKIQQLSVGVATILGAVGIRAAIYKNGSGQ